MISANGHQQMISIMILADLNVIWHDLDWCWRIMIYIAYGGVRSWPVLYSTPRSDAVTQANPMTGPSKASKAFEFQSLGHISANEVINTRHNPQGWVATLPYRYHYGEILPRLRIIHRRTIEAKTGTPVAAQCGRSVSACIVSECKMSLA